MTAKREAGQRWNCAACGEPLVGALTIKGMVAPVEVKPSEGANCFLFRNGGVVHVATAAGEHLDWLREQGVELRFNHFATCESKDQFKPKKEATA
jgi:hypothetical protein